MYRGVQVLLSSYRLFFFLIASEALFFFFGASHVVLNSPRITPEGDMANSALSYEPDVMQESAVELSSEEQAAGVMLADPRWG